MLRYGSFLIFFVVSASITFWSTLCHAELRLTPSLTIGEEYTDNVYDSIEPKTDYITHAMPGLALKYLMPRLDVDVAYILDYRYYAKSSIKDDYTHNLRAKGLATIIENLLYIDVSDEYKRVSLDLARDYTQETPFANQTDSNTFSASPYIILKPSSQLTARLAYRFADIWYKDPVATSKRIHEGMATTEYEINPRLFAKAGYTFTYSEPYKNPEGAVTFRKHTAFIGPKYEYADRSFIHAEAGYTSVDFDGGLSFATPYWSAGIIHTFDTIIVTLDTAVTYDEDPLQGLTQQTAYNAKVEKTLSRGSIAFYGGYSRYKDTKTDTLKTGRYTAGFDTFFEIQPKLTGRLGFMAARYDQPLSFSYTDRFFVAPSITYAMPNDFALTLRYSYVNLYSPGIAQDNKTINRIVIEATKTF